MVLQLIKGSGKIAARSGDSVSILIRKRCLTRVNCSLRYLQVTTEVVDWDNGEDPIYRTIIPVNNAERSRLTISKPLDTSIIEAIGVQRRSLRYAWPKGQDPSTYWSTGVHVGVHD
jgi:hypothetical protein